jgi:hypothetical protein
VGSGTDSVLLMEMGEQKLSPRPRTTPVVRPPLLLPTLLLRHATGERKSSLLWGLRPPLPAMPAERRWCFRVVCFVGSIKQKQENKEVNGSRGSRGGGGEEGGRFVSVLQMTVGRAPEGCRCAFRPKNATTTTHRTPWERSTLNERPTRRVSRA